MITIGALLIVMGLIEAFVVDIETPGVSVAGLGLLVAFVGAVLLAWAGGRRRWLVTSMFRQTGRYLSWARKSPHMDVR
jgi:hypothetical protein